MKRFFLLFCGLIVSLLLAACQQEEEPPASQIAEESSSSSEEEVIPPDPTRPDGAVVVLIEGAKQWDTSVFAGYLPDGVSLEESIPASLQGTLQDILARIDYTILGAETEGNAARVELELTAINAESAVADAISAATKYVIQQQMAGTPIEDVQEIADVIAASMDVAALPAQTTVCTAYMLQQEDGTWQVDMQDERNLPLLNAASGGALTLLENLQVLAEQYGILLQ